VRTAAEVRGRIQLPLLGRIPPPPRRLQGGKGLVMLSDPRSPLAEPFRIVATNLEFANLGYKAKTILFTSAKRGEGKSTTVANLAVALARGGHRVILVDLDLRKPTIQRLFKLAGGPGLTRAALGIVSPDDALVPIVLAPAGDDAENESEGALNVLPVGPLPTNPGEFVNSIGLSNLLAQLEERAELILVDAPPLLDISDAMTLSAHVDGLVIVSRVPVVRRSELAELHRLLLSSPAAKLGFVLTGTVDEAYGGTAYGEYGAPQGAEVWEKAV
jgi:capsular exopolysaccharide synthesis family protein